MTIPVELRLQVRQRAKFACEFCSVTEIDAGGELTVDHFQPQAKGGADHLDNLVYCCIRCNQYKADYWPTASNDPTLWNPRQEPIETHFLTLADGTLFPITATGTFTLKRLRLNRPPLVAFRLRKYHQAEEQRLLTRYRAVVELLEQLYQQQADLLEEQRALFEEQRAILNFLLRRTE